MDRLHAAVVIRRHGNAIAFSALRNHPVPFWKRTGLEIGTSFCQRNVAVHRSHLSNGDSDDVAVIHGETMRTTHRIAPEWNATIIRVNVIDCVHRYALPGSAWHALIYFGSIGTFICLPSTAFVSTQQPALRGWSMSLVVLPIRSIDNWQTSVPVR